MSTNQYWLPQIDQSICDGCGKCVAVCPNDVLGLQAKTAVVITPTACNYCGLCEQSCPINAIVLPYQIIVETKRE